MPDRSTWHRSPLAWPIATSPRSEASRRCSNSRGSRPMRSIEGEEALAQFRAGLTGPRGLDLLRAHGGRALIQLPVGIGKSRYLDEITLEAGVRDQHDL